MALAIVSSRVSPAPARMAAVGEAALCTAPAKAALPA